MEIKKLKIRARNKRLLMEGQKTLLAFIRWLAAACIIGIVVGLIGTAFFYSLDWATNYRINHSYLFLFLPFAGLFIVFTYHLCKDYNAEGTNRVITAIHSDEKITPKMAPLIFLSTIITHLFGGSAGREGAALQLGGSIAELLGRWFHVTEKDRHVIVMCGMSAGFAALFGTPLASTIFAMEVISVGVMYYVALVPCAVSALIACTIAKFFGIHPERYVIMDYGGITLGVGARIILVVALCGLLSIVFCYVMHKAGNLYRKYFPNQYIRIFAGGCLLILLTFIFQTDDYLGGGLPIIAQSIHGQAKPEAFLLKLLFTAVTLNAGFKGGEIVPSFFVGSAFGCVMGGLLGLDPGVCAALGMIAVFCGVTNCPIASLIISFELFGFTNTGYFLLTVGVSYMLSGYSGLYSTQKIMYSKVTPKYVNRRTN